MGCASSTAVTDGQAAPAPPASSAGAPEWQVNGARAEQRGSQPVRARVDPTELQPLNEQVAGRPDSPTERRVAPQALVPKQRDDGILTIDGDVGDEADDSGDRASTLRAPPGAAPGPEDPTGSHAWSRVDSIKASAPAVLTLPGGKASSSDNLEESLQSLQLATGAGKSTATATGPATRYGKGPVGVSDPTTLSISDSDDEDEKPGFDMARWKRFYHWNKRKPQELLRFLWKRFDSKAWSIFCASYLQQASIFASFQGENIIHGLACRLEELMSQRKTGVMGELFAILHTLADTHAESYKVVGVFILRGSAQHPPPELVSALEPGEWMLSKADPQDPLVRTFLSTLIASQSPVQQQYNIVSTRELL